MTEDTPTTEPTATIEAPATPEVVESLPSELLTPEPEAAPAATPTAGGWYWGTGRRKASVARVRIRSGSGEFKVNGRELTEFFTEERDHKSIGAVMATTKTTGGIEVAVKVHGGGYSGQAGAIILGLSRALLRYDGSLEPTLRDHGFLSRDPRRVERKKPGQPGARKRFQFSKR
jgi:small subunit ribosomal protein S9